MSPHLGNKRWLGNAILSLERGSLIRTEYFFGQSCDLVMHLIQPLSDICEEVIVAGKWTFRKMHFAIPRGRQFE
ncbi:uncharacterized protein N7479_003045 [Penicillium vulpinum]|uniref:uncharacterized protein n=1 Tax=Penicillium vulpinum TaxID=29845 RepID=UPI002548F0B0|nr:uncharacterized protein N7479_003045 [Penicillium vulpinum]KAJ5973127.1 hypothetical protein N7479_003045 [Penicillium vulpinum]